MVSSPQLDLAPVVAAAAGPVGRLDPLGHDALEPSPARGVEQRRAVVVDLREHDDRGPRHDQLLEPLAPAAPGLGDERLAVELEQVEDDVGDVALAALEELEARDAVFVERAQLPVEHAIGARERVGQGLGDRAVLALQCFAVARPQAHVVALNARDRAESVPLDLEAPGFAGGHVLRRSREHRRVGWGVAWHKQL